MHALLARHADADAVLHSAAQVAVTTSVADPRTDFAVNALGTLNVLGRSARRPAAEWRSLRRINWVRDNAHLVDANPLVGTQAAVHAQRSTAA